VTPLVRAAGGVLLRPGRSGLEVVLVHRPAYDDWSFPKGKLEGDEDERAAAVREVAEETGLTCALDDDLGVVTYVDGRGRPKVVRYWRMSVPDDAELAPAHEIDRAEWVPLGEAARRLTYPHDRDLLARITGDAEPDDPVEMFLIRHVKAGSRDAWREPDELRPVSSAGRRQSVGLVARFDGVPIRRLFASPYLRCIQTLEPLADARGLEIELAHELSEGAPPAAAEALVLAAAADGPAAFSTHGDVQQGVVEELLERGADLDPGTVAFKKAGTWVLSVVGGTVASVRYLPPPGDGPPVS
jgi:8-oxo-dGTP pyrophosphatase MutT (NUDIX family)/phosphohistidine phosphatase SixA